MKTVIAPLLISFVITAVLTPILIPVLRRMKFGQTEREEGVKSHLKKAGTPTMGGITFLIASVVATLIFEGECPKVVPVMILVVGFGVIGFVDDYLKVVKKRSDGLFPKQKLVLQFIVTTIFVIVLCNATDVGLGIIIPFTGGSQANIGILAFPLLYIVVLATVNGVNFTDGLDGLASSVTIIVAGFFMAAAIAKQTGLEPASCAVMGGLMGFLLYNVYPAKVFMGDTGSLALGGFVAGMAYMLNMPLFIVIVGIIYAIELVTVVLQVAYFKKTNGKRMFKMTPIHHHFELCNWSEPKIVAVFTIITALACFIGFCGI